MVERRLTRLLDEVADAGPIPERSPRDWLLTAVALVVVLIEMVVAPGQAVVRATVGVGTAALIPWRRQHPLASLVAALGLHVSLETMARRAELPGDATIGQIFAGMLVVYALCRWDRPNRVLVGVLLLVGAFVGTELLLEYGPNDLSFVVSWLALAVFALAMRYRRVSVDQRPDEVRLKERELLARELHDTVAHHVSAIAIQAQAGRTLAASDPGAALDALETIEREASRTLAEMRGMVGALRRGAEPDLAPQRGVHDIERLAGSAAGGPAVHVELSGDLEELGPSLDVALYRLAQESITNARRHAKHATRVDVSVVGGPLTIRLTVTDDGLTSPNAKPTAGYGLIGMAERVKLLGGSMEAGPGPDRGWVTSALLPRTANLSATNSGSTTPAPTTPTSTAPANATPTTPPATTPTSTTPTSTTSSVW